ncbi:MAG TPA: AarF/ABC1/UbiB kinase family protein [Roseiflexaceae bacterium]|nr:AarF/ABC1/UbiB kinase family protein [Roseiflexaceae bacterium]
MVFNKEPEKYAEQLYIHSASSSTALNRATNQNDICWPPDEQTVEAGVRALLLADREAIEWMSMYLKTKHGHLDRYQQIAAILVRHGLGWLALDLGLGDLIPFHKGLLGHPTRTTPYTRPEHVRMALEDLGVTFIKLGQILSTRPDVLPPEYIAELARLQDAVPPVAFSEIAAVVEAELGGPLETIFATFDQAPRAAASVGQAHVARLPDGTPVIVKVQRPGIESVVEQDLAVLADLARVAASRSALKEHANLEELVDEFAVTLRDELDYTMEGRNTDRFRHAFADEPALRIPRIEWRLTSRRVLTMEEIHGVKIGNVASLDSMGIDRMRLAETCLRITLIEIFDHGFFHADPHPGNFFVLPGGTIGLIDFGMVGRLDSDLRGALLRLTLALIRQDSRRMLEELLEIGVAPGALRTSALRRDLDRLIDHVRGRAGGEMVASQALYELLRIAYRHRLRLPTEIALLAKVIAMSEGLGAMLDPQFRFLEMAEPHLRHVWLRSYGPKAVTERLVEEGADIVRLSLGLPTHLRGVLRRIERGDVQVLSRIENLDTALGMLRRIANRLALSILAAALMISTALLMLVYHPPGWDTWGGWFFTASFVIAMGVSLRLMWQIWRDR